MSCQWSDKSQRIQGFLSDLHQGWLACCLDRIQKGRVPQEQYSTVTSYSISCIVNGTRMANVTTTALLYGSCKLIRLTRTNEVLGARAATVAKETAMPAAVNFIAIENARSTLFVKIRIVRRYCPLLQSCDTCFLRLTTGDDVIPASPPLTTVLKMDRR